MHKGGGGGRRRKETQRTFSSVFPRKKKRKEGASVTREDEICAFPSPRFYLLYFRIAFCPFARRRFGKTEAWLFFHSPPEFCWVSYAAGERAAGTTLPFLPPLKNFGRTDPHYFRPPPPTFATAPPSLFLSQAKAAAVASPSSKTSVGGRLQRQHAISLFSSPDREHVK